MELSSSIWHIETVSTVIHTTANAIHVTWAISHEIQCAWSCFGRKSEDIQALRLCVYTPSLFYLNMRYSARAWAMAAVWQNTKAACTALPTKTLEPKTHITNRMDYDHSKSMVQAAKLHELSSCTPSAISMPPAVAHRSESWTGLLMHANALNMPTYVSFSCR